MKIYIDEKKCTGCGKLKLPAQEVRGFIPLKKKMERNLYILKDSSCCLGCRICVTICMEDTMPLRTHFKKRRIEKFVT